MESLSALNKHTTFAQSQGEFQEYFQQSNQNFHPNHKRHEISTYQEKAPFFRYASSLLEIGIEDQQKSQQIPVYEQSELLNPPESLIQKYETMRKERPSFGNISCESILQNNRSIRKIEKGLSKLAAFLQRKYNKNRYLYQNKPPQSLIDILAISSVENLTHLDERISIKEGFLKIKSFFYRSVQKQKQIKPSIPIDKKKNYQQQIKKSNPAQYVLSVNKRQGTQHLVGSLTFKLLFLQSQCFKFIKQHVLRKKLQQLFDSTDKVLMRHYFRCLKQYIQHNPSKYSSKILTLSKSKSKTSFSKLKVLNNVGSQKKLSIKKYHSHEDEEMTGDEQLNQRVINSQILQNFDFTQFKSKINEDDIESSDRKMGFNNMLKKKNSNKQSISQAETVNSKRSFQSEYQFAQGVSSKVFTSRKPISVRNFTHEDQDALQQIPTEKFIRKKKSQQKFQFHKNLFVQQIKVAKELKQFRKQERRYLNVRTNLFELPLQTQSSFRDFSSKKIVNKQQMSKIYHLMADGLMKNQGSQDIKDSLIMNLNSMVMPNIVKHVRSENKIDTYKQSIEREQKKKRLKQHKDLEKMQKYYFDLGIAKSDKNLQLPDKTPQHNEGFKHVHKGQQKPITKLKTQPQIFQINSIQSPNNNRKVTHNILPQQLNHHAQHLIKQNNKKSPKLKLKKSDNLEDYYFKTDANKVHQSIAQPLQTERISSPKGKLIRAVNQRQYQTSTSPQMNHQPNVKQFHQAQYRTSKIVNQGNFTKNIKSLSPSIRLSPNSSYRTGKLGSRLVQQNVNQDKVFFNGQQKFQMMNTTPSKIFSSSGDSKLKAVNQLPIEPQSSGLSTPKNIHQFVSGSNPSIMMQNRSKSKLKLFSQTSRPLSPQQQPITQHWFPSQNSDRKGSFISNMMPQKIMTLNRPSSNNVFIPTQGSLFTPTNSNLSNQSGFTNNIHKVINYGPNAGFNQEIINRPSSILSTHSNQSKEKIMVGRSSQQLLSPTQRQMHMMMSPPEILMPNTNLSPRVMMGIQQQSPRAQHDQMMVNNSRRGLNIMIGGDQMMNAQRPSSNTSLTKLNGMIRPKSISSQKIFLTVRK